jgi:hypothetical protein
MFVITPNGEVLEFPTAHYLSHLNNHQRLATKKDHGTWVANIPAGWAVCHERPTVLGDSTDLGALKRALRNFDARTGEWKHG